MPNALTGLLCSKQCWHNVRVPTVPLTTKLGHPILIMKPIVLLVSILLAAYVSALSRDDPEVVHVLAFDRRQASTLLFWPYILGGIFTSCMYLQGTKMI